MLVHGGMTVTFIRESECTKPCYNNQLWNKNRNVTIPFKLLSIAARE